MNLSGRTYLGKDAFYVAFYSHNPDVTFGVPPSLEGNAQRAAHIAYTYGRKSGSLDVFKLDYLPDKLPESFNLGPIRLPKKGLSHVDRINDIQFDLIKGTNPEVIELARRDIDIYCGQNPAKNPQGSRISWHEVWIPRTQVNRIHLGSNKKRPSFYLSGGKQEYTPSCGLDANLDFAKGCIAGWVPGEKASFDGKTFVNFFLNPFFECPPCYAEKKHRTFPKTIWEINREKLKDELIGNCCLYPKTKEVNGKLVPVYEMYGKPISVLRLGKRTEPGSKYTLDSLVTTLEVCAETRTQVIMPTRFLEFNAEIAKLYKKTNSTILYSIGWDELERGAVSHGCTTEFRIEQARKYKEAGANALFYLNFHPLFEPGERELKIIEIAKRAGMPFIQVLPIRFYKPEIMTLMTGLSLHSAKATTSSMIEQRIDDTGAYKMEGEIAVPERFHPAWQKMIEDNHGFVRMCHHNSKLTWCGGCNLHNGFIIPKEKPVPRLNLKRTRKDKTHPSQMRLNFGK